MPKKNQTTTGQLPLSFPTTNIAAGGNSGEVLIFEPTNGGGVRLEVRLVNESVWLSLNQMAALFDVDKSGISRHLKNVFESGELAPAATVAIFATAQTEGERVVSRQVEYYNLDAIISARMVTGTRLLDSGGRAGAEVAAI
jgi:hypothetical protein